MRLYGAIEKVEAQSDGTVRVYGIATSEAIDEQGEIVRAAAIRAAVPDYMRFPALREMHQLSAAGTTLEAEVGEDGTTRIVAHVVDPVAVAKVKNQVYRGFSIGGRVTQRDIENPKIITGLVLNEISLVDRPANPEAIFDCWKAGPAYGVVPDDCETFGPRQGSSISGQAAAAPSPFNSPLQIWSCEVPGHHHLAKADAVRCLEKVRSKLRDREAQAIGARPSTSSGALSASAHRKTSGDREGGNVEYADPGYQPDRKKRYPIDTDAHIRAAWGYINKPGNAGKYNSDQLRQIRAAIIAAWKAKIDKDGPPSAEDSDKAARAGLAKALWDTCHVVRVIIDLEWLKNALDLQAAMENDGSQQSTRLQEIIAELCDFLNGLVSAETDELSATPDGDGPTLASVMPAMLAMTVGSSGALRVAALFQKSNPSLRSLAAALLVKAKPSRADQELMDMAYRACDKCLSTPGLSSDEQDSVLKARYHLEQAGALVIPNWAADVAEANDGPWPRPECGPDGVTGSNPAKVLEVLASSVGKRGQVHQQFMDMAHGCVGQLTDGAFCGKATKIGARHSKETMQHLEAAHHHLVAAGAECNTAAVAGFDTSRQDDAPIAELALARAAPAGDVVKLLAGERAEKATLVKVLGEIVPMLEHLTKRVDDIARTSLPPLTMARSTASLSKQQDRGGGIDNSASELSPEAVAAALSRMSKEEQTLTLIKASYANPIRVARSVAEE